MRIALGVAAALVVGLLAGIGLSGKTDLLAPFFVSQAVPASSQLEPATEPAAGIQRPTRDAYAWENAHRLIEQLIGELTLTRRVADARMAELESQMQSLREQLQSMRSQRQNAYTPAKKYPLEPGQDLDLTTEALDVISPQPDTTAAITEIGWFVHIGSTRDESEALSWRDEAFAATGLRVQIHELEGGVFWVRICQLPTQAGAQDLVRTLRLSTQNDALWIGRGCQPRRH